MLLNLTNIIHDLQYAWRVLAKRPAATAIAIVSLALGIGANTTVFSIIEKLVLRPLAVTQPNELVWISITRPDSHSPREEMTWSLFLEIQKRQQVFSGFFGRRDSGLRQLGGNGDAYVGVVDAVSSDYFSTLRVQMLLGRPIVSDDVDIDRGSAQVAVLSYRCWQERYQGDPGILGKIFTLDDLPLEIVGVTGKDFTGLSIEGAMEATVPLGLKNNSGAPLTATIPSVFVAARLKQGTTMEQARSQLLVMWPAIQAALIESKAEPPDSQLLARKIQMESASTGDSFLRDRLSRPLTIMMALAAALLLIACVNLANLMLAWTFSRRQELAVRVALGARLIHLLRALLSESILLSGIGAAAGVMLSYWSTSFFLNLIWFGYYPNIANRTIDTTPGGRVAAFSVLVMLLTAVTVGVVPARMIGRTDPRSAIQHGSRTIRDGVGLLTKALVISQIALSLVLVTMALLFSNSIHSIRSTDLGYRRDGVMILQLFPTTSQPIPNRSIYYQELAIRLASQPGVRSVSYSNFGPVSGYERKETISSSSLATPPIRVALEVIGPDFFRLLGMKLVAGRDFNWSDSEQTKRVVIVSDGLAHRLFPGENPIGRIVDFARKDRKSLEIVGVVSTASLWLPQTIAPLAVYEPLMQEPGYDNLRLDIGTDGDPRAVVAAARKTITDGGHHAVLRAQTLDERLDGLLTSERVLAMIGSFVGGMALLLAAIGLYGLMSFTVTLRIPEIGTRMALGGSRATIRFMFVKDAMWLVLPGIFIGIPAAFMTTKIAARLIPGLPPIDSAAIFAASIVLFAVSLCAVLLPVEQASRIDPMTVLRS